MASLVDRIIQFMESKGENISSFSTRCGLSNGTLNKALKNKRGISAETIKRILDANPDLRADWLFDLPRAEGFLGAEASEKYEKSEGKNPKTSHWSLQMVQEMQDMRQRLLELERKTKHL